jgi:hypothetical protein
MALSSPLILIAARTFSTDVPMRIVKAAELVETFARGDLTGELARIERQLEHRDVAAVPNLLSTRGIDSDLVTAALLLKETAGQIHVLLHAIGILMSLPAILEPEERVLRMSLGAGNTGRSFDVETDRRVAEFKFIRWRGGAEAVRQNALFKDFYMLSEASTTKRKVLYLLDLNHPLKFLNGRRSIRSVMSRNSKLYQHFAARYGSHVSVVREYFVLRRGEVELVDLIPLVPSLGNTM